MTVVPRIGVRGGIAREFRLDLHEAVIQASQREQLLVGPLLDDLPLVHDEDAVGVFEGAQAVGDGDDRQA